jgi:hypothetical protein
VGRSQKRDATEELPGGQPVQNDPPAVRREHELLPLTFGEKEHSLCGVISLNDHSRPGQMPMARRRHDGSEFGRRQSAEQSWH